MEPPTLHLLESQITNTLVEVTIIDGKTSVRKIALPTEPIDLEHADMYLQQLLGSIEKQNEARRQQQLQFEAHQAARATEDLLDKVVAATPEPTHRKRGRTTPKAKPARPAEPEGTVTPIRGDTQTGAPGDPEASAETGS